MKTSYKVKRYPFGILTYRVMGIFLLLTTMVHSLQSQEEEIVDTSMAAIYAMSLEELLDTKVTIATKSDQKISETPAIVSVITAEDIKNMGFRELEEVLALLPGFEMFKLKEGSNPFSIRGITNLNQGARVLVLLDGTPYNDIMYGSAMFSGLNLNINSIEKIEVIRGPGSALYGRNAFSTVISIITKSASNHEGLELNSSYGSYNTYDIGLSYGIKKEKYEGFVSARKLYTDGTNSTFSNGMGGESLWDIHHDNYFCNANFTIGNFKISGHYSNLEDGVSSGFYSTNGKNCVNLGIYSIEYTNQLTDRLKYRIKIYGRNENRIQDIEFFKPTFTDTFPAPYPAIPVNELYPNGMYAKPQFKSYVYGTELEINYNLFRNNYLLFGIQADMHGIKDATIRANYNFNTSMPLPIIKDSLIGYYDKNNMPLFTGNEGWIRNGGHDYYNFAFLLQDIYYPINNLGITIGARYDFDSEISPVLNPRLGVVYEFLQNAHIKLLYGQAYRVPTCSEQFKLTGFDIGNEKLEHEKIQSAEIAFSYKTMNTFSQISVFNNKAHNLIVRNSNPADINYKKYYNIGENTSKGMEFENRVYFTRNLMSFVNYSYVNSENTEEVNDTLTRTFEAPNFSKHRFNVGFNYKFLHHFNLNSYLKYQGPVSKFTTLAGDPISQQDIGNVFLLNTTFGTDIQEWLYLSFSVYNLLDQEYYYQSDQLSIQPKQNGRHYIIRLNLHF